MVEDSQNKVQEEDAEQSIDDITEINLSDKGDGWFQVLRSSGAVMSTGGATGDLFNISFGRHRKRTDIEDDEEEENNG